MINQLLPLPFRHVHDGLKSFAKFLVFGFAYPKSDLAGAFLVGLPVGNGARVSHQEPELLLKSWADVLFPCRPFVTKRRSVACMSAPRFEDHNQISGAGETSRVVIGLQRIQPSLPCFTDLAIGNKFTVPYKVFVISPVQLWKEFFCSLEVLPNLLGISGIKKPFWTELFGPALALAAIGLHAACNLVDFPVRSFHAYGTAVLLGSGGDTPGGQTHGE
ncbi:hypothetical protein SAMN04515695_6113 [Pseudovibrio sp. Tun.PSC04-5.I4]|nr:hypothetical protein SAMN04515695_6113 [Pseudovibrio sp. Tun.PSC04-5.I4]